MFINNYVLNTIIKLHLENQDTHHSLLLSIILKKTETALKTLKSCKTHFLMIIYYYNSNLHNCEIRFSNNTYII